LSPDSSPDPGAVWQIWVDTGGTFTDCAARSPDGGLHRAKVLSTSAVRGTLWPAAGDRVRFDAGWEPPAEFYRGARLHVLGGAAAAVRSSTAGGELALDGRLEVTAGAAGEVTFAEPAPVLAARWVTRTPAGVPLPRLALRLATTRGTNALLERRGGRVALFVTAGFGDLLVIGTQQRDDLFALKPERPEPLYLQAVEVEERLAADGSVVRPLDLEALAATADALLGQGVDCAAVALVHSYRNPEPERRLAAFLSRRGWRHVSVSSELAARPRILPRAETAVINAYLAPVIESYLNAVQAAIGGGTLHAMTSAGGLVGAAEFQPKDSLLSGPAGGVVGAAAAGRAAGHERLVTFDMGGTSTDVSRVAEPLDYRPVTEVGGVRLLAPSLAIETVAAGGGSVCWFDGLQVRVGPQSAGADPGPAAYGAGGPLTLTDVNLLLGRVDPAHFAIPLDVEASRREAERLRDAVGRQGGEDLDLETLLGGLLAIADERMAEAIRRISIRRGYAVADHTLVAFGGAGGQHACSVARILGMRRVLVPADAGILSALGLGAARLERFAERAVPTPWEDAAPRLGEWFEALARVAVGRLESDGVTAERAQIARRTLDLRLVGQASAVTVEWDERSDPAAAFAARYVDLYGYSPPADAALEVDSLRLVAAATAAETAAAAPSLPEPRASRGGRHRAWLGGAWGEWPAWPRSALRRGDRRAGPALVWEAHSSTVVEAGWSVEPGGGGALELVRQEETP
jgi:5-oxoprolinase (ATP-hydrolysing)